MAVVHLPGGGKVLTFAPPPADFNPLKAGESELLAHGFPRRPTEDPELLKRWEHAMSRPYRVIVPQFRRMEYKRHHLPGEGHPPRRPAAHGTETTSIWSGAVVYAPAGTTMKWVEGNWTVPNAYPPTGAIDGVWYSASSWIGIDGDGSNDVLQAGCDSDVMTSGGVISRQCNPWWEWYPGGTFWISNFTVSQGDELSCLICVDANSNTAGQIFLSNVTSGLAMSFAPTAPTGVALQGNCAEWIVEALEIDTNTPELARYGDVFFDGANAGTVSGASLQAGSGNVINMVNASNQVISTGMIETPTLVKCSYTG
jgi:hypothetical protein